MCKKLYVVDSSSKLYTIDPVTATTKLIGPCGMAQVTDIAFYGPALYGVSFTNFLRIDPMTGKATNVGVIGPQTQTNGLVVAEDGTIYAGTLDGKLITINPATGVGATIGSFGGGFASGGDLAIDSNGNLYGALTKTGNIYLAQISRINGLATSIGNTGLNTLYGMDFFCCHLYGVTEDGNMAHINVATGAATVVGKNSIKMWGMSTYRCCC